MPSKRTITNPKRPESTATVGVIGGASSYDAEQPVSSVVFHSLEGSAP